MSGWFPLMISSWMDDPFVRQLAPADRTVYLELLLTAWSEGGVREEWIESRWLAGKIGVSQRKLRSVWTRVRVKFDQKIGESFTNSKLEYERKLAEERSQKARNAINSRWARHTNVLPGSSTNVIPSTPHHTTPHRTEETNHEPDRPADIIPLQPKFDFDRIYALYPRKLGKKRGLKLCVSRVRTAEQYSALEQAVRNYARAAEVEITEQRFVKHFDSFIGCWEEYVDYEPRVRAGPPRSSAESKTHYEPPSQFHETRREVKF